MRVLFFSNSALKIDSDGIHGAGNWASCLVKAIIRKDEISDVFFAFHDSGIKGIETEKYGTKLTLLKIPTNTRKSKYGKLLDYWLIRDPFKSGPDFYHQIIATYHPDIIQIFGMESPFIRIIGSTAIPVVIHIQGLLLPYLFKFYLRISTFQLIRYTELNRFFKAHTPIHEKIACKRHIRLEKSKYSLCKNFLGRTDWDRFVVRAVAPLAKYYYCQEILREPFYQNQWIYAEHVPLRIFTTTREAFYKNVDIIFETVDILERFNPELDFLWKIAGVDESDITPRLMRKKGYKSGHLILLGRLSASDLINEMLSSDLFVFPSAIENSPNALQEAMLVGMPVVSTNAGGISSLIEHEKSGYLVPEGDPYSMAGAILELKDSREKMVSYGRCARNVALERNDPDKVTSSLLNIYREIISNRQ